MNVSRVQDVDVALTTRELSHMITKAGIDFVGLEDSEMDVPLGLGYGAADIFAKSGGVMEAARLSTNFLFDFHAQHDHHADTTQQGSITWRNTSLPAYIS